MQDRGRWGYQLGGAGGRRRWIRLAHRPWPTRPSATSRAAAARGHADRPGTACLERRLRDGRCGADLGASIDGRPLPIGDAVEVRAGSTRALRPAALGRSRVPGVRRRHRRAAGSRQPATHLAQGMGGLHGRRAEGRRSLDDWRPLGAGQLRGRRRAAARVPEPGGGAGSGCCRVRSANGWVGAQSMRSYARGSPCTPQSNRMGYRLHGGTQLRRRRSRRDDLRRDGPGGIQVPPVGQPILLMADRQTTGGYPMLATVITADLPLAASSRQATGWSSRLHPRCGRVGAAAGGRRAEHHAARATWLWAASPSWRSAGPPAGS